MTTLREKQSEFVLKIAELIQWADTNGYALTFGEAYRTDEQAVLNSLGYSNRQIAVRTLRSNPLLIKLADAIANNPKEANGIVKSLHTERLALDFNVFMKDGTLCQPGEILKLGQYWESIGGTWGGRFGDPSHFSMEWNGVK